MAAIGRHCTATTAKGEACRAFAMTGSEYCFHHDPAASQERAEARRKGGQARHGRRLARSGMEEPLTIRSVGDVVGLLEHTINDVLALENSLNRARTVGYLATAVVKALELAEMEERVAALEATLRLRGRNGHEP